MTAFSPLKQTLIALLRNRVYILHSKIYFFNFKSTHFPRTVDIHFLLRSSLEEENQVGP